MTCQASLGIVNVKEEHVGADAFGPKTTEEWSAFNSRQRKKVDAMALSAPKGDLTVMSVCLGLPCVFFCVGLGLCVLVSFWLSWVALGSLVCGGLVGFWISWFF